MRSLRRALRGVVPAGVQAILLTFSWWLAGGSAHALSASDVDPFPKTAAAYLVNLDGQTIWQRQAGARLPMASLTKLMTALVVLESGNAGDVVAIHAKASAQTGSRAGLRRGERYARDSLLAAMMVASANDACLALAEHAAGSEAAFVQRMNQRARQMGLADTHFVNACGFDATGHVSTVNDVLTLARAVSQQPVLMQMVAQKEGSIEDLDRRRTLKFSTTNALIGRYPAAVGLKTGTTAKAGRCLVALARKDGHEVWLVMLHAGDRWWDAVDILELAFARAHATH